MASGGDCIAEMIQCSICQETLNEPKLLPCSHTFCLDCLVHWILRQPPNCPLCRGKYKIPAGGPVNLPNNLTMLALIDQHQTMLEARKDPQCELCTGDYFGVARSPAAQMHCLDCKYNLCRGCAMGHVKMKETKKHRLISMKDWELRSAAEKCRGRSCAQHRSKTLEMYCFDCHLMVCFRCWSVLHKDHEVEHWLPDDSTIPVACDSHGDKLLPRTRATSETRPTNGSWTSRNQDSPDIRSDNSPLNIEVEVSGGTLLANQSRDSMTESYPFDSASANPRLNSRAEASSDTPLANSLRNLSTVGGALASRSSATSTLSAIEGTRPARASQRSMIPISTRMAQSTNRPLASRNPGVSGNTDRMRSTNTTPISNIPRIPNTSLASASSTSNIGRSTSRPANI